MSFMIPLAEAAGAGEAASGASEAASGAAGEAADTSTRSEAFDQGQQDKDNSQKKPKGIALTIGSLFGK